MIAKLIYVGGTYVLKHFVFGYVVNKYVVPKLAKVASQNYNFITKSMEPIRYF